MAILNTLNFFKSTPGAGFGLQFLRKLLVVFLETLTIVDYQVIQTVWGQFVLSTTTACEAFRRNALKLTDSGCVLLRHDWTLDSLHCPINLKCYWWRNLCSPQNGSFLILWWLFPYGWLNEANKQKRVPVWVIAYKFKL